MKILLHNIAYGTGLNGSWKQYFFKVWRYFWLPLYSGRCLLRTLKKQNADIYCLLEVDAGSLRNRYRSQVKKLAKVLSCDYSYSRLKYSMRSIWRFFVFFRRQHDAILSKMKGEYRYHYLRSGMKKLVQEYVVNGISVFAVHLAVLGRMIRRKQLEQLSQILKKCPRPFVLCGDFNIHKGLKEVRAFSQEMELKLVELPATWPSCNPKKHFDLFFISNGIKLRNADVVKTECSDHLPVWIEIDH
jgi:endonuclease/exonuclease/phosphatase family metal-dependent hydrolase